MKKHYYLFVLLVLGLLPLQGQEHNGTQKVLRVNFINPGVEAELPLFGKTILAVNTGLGFNLGHYELTFYGGGSGLKYYYSPFADVAFKYLYNLDKREQKGRSTKYNSGNYISLRSLINFKEVEKNNVIRTDSKDFAIGPTWGFQRAYRKFHLLFDIGPVYYFDTKGNIGFFPIMMQLNIGLNIKNW